MKNFETTLIFIIAALFGSYFAIDISLADNGDVIVINDETPLERNETYLTVEEQFNRDLDRICAEYNVKTAGVETAETTSEYLIDVTDEEIELMARVVMSEASVLDQTAKDAVAQVIVNRVRSDYKEFAYQTTVTDVINAPNQFYTGDNGAPNEDCYLAVNRALTMEQYPPDLLWFRKYGVKYGYLYLVSGTGNRTTYFSTVFDYEKLVEERGEF